jgi:hypothetical protein
MLLLQAHKIYCINLLACVYADLHIIPSVS